MGKLVGWDFNYENKIDKCKKCGQNKLSHKGCCKDEQKQFKINDQKPADVNPVIFFGKTFVAESPQYLRLLIFSEAILTTPIANSPPLSPKIPVFIRNCVYRI